MERKDGYLEKTAATGEPKNARKSFARTAFRVVWRGGVVCLGRVFLLEVERLARRRVERLAKGVSNVRLLGNFLKISLTTPCRFAIMYSKEAERSPLFYFFRCGRAVSTGPRRAFGRLKGRRFLNRR